MEINKISKELKRRNRSIQPEEVIIDPKYIEMIRPLIIQFRNTLPKPNDVLVQSFNNYLVNQMRGMRNLNEVDVKKNIEQIAQSIINADLPTKLDLLEDKSLEEIYDISNYIFKLARKTLEQDERLEEVKNGSVDFKSMMRRMAELKKSVKPYNRTLADVIAGEAASDSRVAVNPVCPILSQRLWKIATLKDDNFHNMRIEFYKRLRQKYGEQDFKGTSSKETVEITIREYNEFKAKYEGKHNKNIDKGEER